MSHRFIKAYSHLYKIPTSNVTRSSAEEPAAAFQLSQAQAEKINFGGAFEAAGFHTKPRYFFPSYRRFIPGVLRRKRAAEMHLDCVKCHVQYTA